MYLRLIYFKIIIFILLFSAVFFEIHIYNLLPTRKLSENLDSIPWLFSAIALIFSILSGFIIQSKWNTWNALIDASQGELTMLRRLHIIAHHFPPASKEQIRQGISSYLEQIIKESTSDYDRGIRSTSVDEKAVKLEDILFVILQKYPESGTIALNYFVRSMEYREKRLQNGALHLPRALRYFFIFSTSCIILSSLFIGVGSLLYYYLFTLIIGLLSFGIYLLVDDLDHPYHEGNWHLSTKGYEELYHVVKKKLESQ